MKLSSVSFVSFVTSLALASLLALASGCASARPELVAPPTTTSADFSDPSWTPPEESGLALDESRLDDVRPVTRSEPSPQPMLVPNGHDAPRGSVRPARPAD